MERRYFGTDGVRGAYGGPVVNEDFFAKMGEAAGRWLESRGVPSGRVLIGRDTRASGAALAAALGGGFARVGGRPVDLGVLPTPAVSEAVRAEGAALGAVITASHNPAADNGVKFFGPDGTKLSDADEAAIESHLGPQSPESRVSGVRAAAARSEPVLGGYIAAASRILPAGSLRGWKIALDTANGATCVSSPAVLKAFGAEISAIGGSPDGLNINAGVGSEHPEALIELVRKTHARLGIAHDGDGDRCLLCDEQGGILDGDELLVILATHALERGTLAKKTLVVTVQSNLALDFAVAEAGGRVIRTAVGDRYVTERMRAEGARLGGESSGHIVCFDIGPTGDGLSAALKVVEVMLQTGRPLSELRKVLRKFPQLSAGLKVREKKPLESLPGITAAIAALERELAGKGRVLVRYSGTEPKLRLLVEGPTEAVAASGIERLRAAAAQDLELL